MPVSKKQIIVSFGERIKALRLERKLSQEDLAFKSELHRTYIGMIERAEKNITLVNIEKLSIALQVPISALFTEIYDAQKPTTAN